MRYGNALSVTTGTFYLAICDPRKREPLRSASGAIWKPADASDCGDLSQRAVG
jgi:hypothetical protein